MLNTALAPQAPSTAQHSQLKQTGTQQHSPAACTVTSQSQPLKTATKLNSQGQIQGDLTLHPVSSPGCKPPMARMRHFPLTFSQVTIPCISTYLLKPSLPLCIFSNYCQASYEIFKVCNVIILLMFSISVCSSGYYQN